MTMNTVNRNRSIYLVGEKEIWKGSPKWNVCSTHMSSSVMFELGLEFSPSQMGSAVWRFSSQSFPAFPSKVLLSFPRKRSAKHWQTVCNTPYLLLHLFMFTFNKFSNVGFKIGPRLFAVENGLVSRFRSLSWKCTFVVFLLKVKHWQTVYSVAFASHFNRQRNGQ